MDGVVNSISVTVTLPTRSDWPVATFTTTTPEVCIKTPHLPFIQRELRSLQGLLSLYGLRSIDIANPTIHWIPESAEEKADMSIFSYRKSLEPLGGERSPPLPFDLLVD
ncbi:MAG TPA: hypothetical protein VLR47_12800 [Rhodospirillales bacterium]|nr:hypothetical protein [Rhodospirillales bacterium]